MPTRKVSSGVTQDLEIMVRIEGDLPCNKGKRGKISSIDKIRFVF